MNKKNKILEWFKTKCYRIDDNSLLLPSNTVSMTKDHLVVKEILVPRGNSGEDWQIFFPLSLLDDAEIYYTCVMLKDANDEWHAVRFYNEPEPLILEPLSKYLKMALIDGLSVANSQANGGYLMEEFEREQVAAWLESSDNPVAAANQQIDDWIADGRNIERPRVIYGGEDIFHKR